MTRARRRPLAGLALLGTVALIAGCGGGGDDDSALSADDFRTQADAICAAFERQTDALEEPGSSGEVLAFLQQGIPIQEDYIAELRALDAPDELAGTYGEALDLLDQQQTAIKDAVARIEGGEDPLTVVGDVDSTITGLNDQADAKAKELGLTVCGSDDAEDGGTSTTPSTTPATTAPAATTPADTTGGAGTGDYLTDVKAATDGLQEFGTILSTSSGIDDLKSKVPQAEGALDKFDAAIERLGEYTIPVAALEKQRAGLAETGPKVSDVLRRFLDAAADGNVAAITELVPEVTKTIGEFQTAATG